MCLLSQSSAWTNSLLGLGGKICISEAKWQLLHHLLIKSIEIIGMKTWIANLTPVKSYNPPLSL